ncbi:rab9 effector protein with kelch motifs-like isoform X1 [Tachypleus tridentatus]|uniref:rab9 effector protein with kelch motifs-like isoform X1 n=1 Tax=Tachypleus tridentatus TaxID=6853 RepID=UPI003FCF5C4A
MSNSESKARVFVVGGANPECTFSDVYCLDLDSLTWTVVETVGFHGCYEHATVKTVHPKPGILVFGGADTEGNKNDIQVLDLKTRMWETIQVKGCKPSPRTHHSVASTDETFMIFSGGHLGSQPVVDKDVYVFHLPSYSWNKLSVSSICPPARLGHVMVAMADQLYVHGGTSGNTFYDDLHVLDLSTCRWKRLDPKGCIPCGRAAHGVVAVQKDFYVFGGLTSEGVVTDLYKYDTSLETWFKINCGDQVPRGRLDFGICLVELSTGNHETDGQDENKNNQCILVHGGMDTNGEIFDDTWVFPL